MSFNFSRNIGHVFENIVFIELMRRKNEIYYGRSSKGKEADFIVKKGLDILDIIQVCASLEEHRTLHRELEAIYEVRAELAKGRDPETINAMRLTLITGDEERLIDEGQGVIHVIPLWKWLITGGEY